MGIEADQGDRGVRAVVSEQSTGNSGQGPVRKEPLGSIDTLKTRTENAVAREARSIPLDVYRGLYLGPLRSAQLQLRSVHVLFQVRNLRRARNRQHHR